MTNMETRYSPSDVPELADKSFTSEVKNHLRRLYADTRTVIEDTNSRLENARKSGEHIGNLIKRKRLAEKFLKEIETHGKRDVYLSEDDTLAMFTYIDRKDFIRHLSFYVTQYK